MDEQVARWPEQCLSAEAAANTLRIAKKDLSRLSDAELMSQLRGGEHQALSCLFDRYHHIVLRIATKIVRDSMEAEDLMQDVFFSVYQSAERFDPQRGSFKNWLIKFAYHKSLNRRKYLSLRGAFEDPGAGNLASQQVSPVLLNEFVSDDSISVVRKGMETLSPKQRKVLEMTCFEGFLFREIADHTNESLGNVRHHYYRAISKLREFVKNNSREYAEERTGVPGGKG